MASNLPNKVLSLPSFKRQYISVIKESVLNQFKDLYNTAERDVDIDWNNLLSCASVLAQSDHHECLDAALRISQQCLISKDTNHTHKISAGVILNSLTNKQAISLAISRNLLPADYEDFIPLTLKLEGIKRDIENSFINFNDEILPINKFQKAVIDATQEADIVSISAPTSSGKSYVLTRLILDDLLDTQRRINIVYLVPTRALVSQVEEEFRDLLAKNLVKDVFLSSVPKITEDIDKYRSTLFVFTQERLHWFKTNHPLFKFDILIVDEAQKIGDGYRGILLQQKIEELVKESPSIKVCFSSPFTSNPEILLSVIKNDSLKFPVKKDYVSVNQNLIFVSQIKGKPQEYDFSLNLNDNPIHLGNFKLPFRPSPSSKILPFVAYSLSNNSGGNLIYSNGQADAEKYALQLYDLFSDSELSQDLKQLIQLVTKVVHPQYKLAVTLRRKIAFHYGNMPLIVRQEIERLFKEGDIHYLVCTSTLLEGVNLPAKSIFIKSPTRGAGQHMNENDFWNLAGRAGRLGKEFQGNIICIEPYKWENIPSTNRSKQVIHKAIDRIISSELIDYIEADTPRKLSSSKQNLEYAFTYYYTKSVDNALEDVLDRDDPLYGELEHEFKRVKQVVEVPNKILLRNPGISPIAQQHLLNYFKSHKNKGELIPVAPESQDAVDNSYVPIINLISNYLTGDSEKMSKTFAILVVNWMQGYPLPIIINQNFRYWERVGKPKKMDEVIRNTMDLIETYARFKFAKYSSCYIDILHYHLDESKRHDLIEELPDLNSWLEYGVSMKTQISLISLGLSRPTTLALTEFITNSNLSKEECIDWVKSNDISLLGLPIVMVNEINQIFTFLNS